MRCYPSINTQVGTARRLQLHLSSTSSYVSQMSWSDPGLPANLGKGDSSRVNAAKMAAKMMGPVPCANALAPYRAPWIVPCTFDTGPFRTADTTAFAMAEMAERAVPRATPSYCPRRNLTQCDASDTEPSCFPACMLPGRVLPTQCKHNSKI